MIKQNIVETKTIKYFIVNTKHYYKMNYKRSKIMHKYYSVSA